MCSETHNSIGEVHRGSLSFLSTQRAKSVIIRLKRWVKNIKNLDGTRIKLAKNSEDAAEIQNADNENKLNIVKSKMAYTIEELQDIVDDNLANEMRELESSSAHE